MQKVIFLSLGVVVVLGTYLVITNSNTEAPSPLVDDYKNATYEIEGETVTLMNGSAEVEAAPGSASKVTTEYFGNDFVTDLNNDGRMDVVFLLTQNSGGSGTMFYVVAALNTEEGYVGSDGYLLGDRIAPQNINVSPNPRHKNVVVANYAVRKEGEPMTTQPSVGESAYLKLDEESMRWGIVEPDFEGEANLSETQNVPLQQARNNGVKSFTELHATEFTTSDWNNFSVKTKNGDRGYTFEYPNDWEYTDSTYFLYNGEKIAEFNPPGLVVLQEGQHCDDEYERDPDWGGLIKVGSQENIVFNDVEMHWKIKEIQGNRVDSYCIEEDGFAFGMQFYNASTDDKELEVFKKVIASVKITHPQ